MISQGIKLEQLLSDFIAMKTGRANGLDNTHSFGELFKKQLQDPKQSKSLMQSSLFDNTKSSSGKDLFENIKKYLQTLGLKMDQIYADSDSLAGLQKIMRNHGFKEEEIKSFFDQLQTAPEGKKIKLSELFTKLNALDDEKEEEEDALLMPSSAVPFFQTILPVLGLDEQAVDSALTYSKTQGGNINMKRLISYLKGFGSVNDETGTPKQLPDNLSQIMKGLGIPTSANQEKQLSLPQFVSRLEMMVHENAGKVISGNQQKQDVLDFLNSLHVNPVFTQNNILTEKMTRLKSTNPLEASKIDSHGKQSPVANNQSGKPISFHSERAGQNLYHAMNRENQLSGKDIQALAGETPDKTGGNNLKSEMQEILEQTIHKRNVKQVTDSSAQNGQLMDIKKDHPAVAGTKMHSDKPLPSYVLNQVSKQIVRSFQDGLSDIRLQLKPPHLGRLQIHMKTINNGLKVSILAENNTTQKLLKTHTAELKAALLEHGIRLEKMDVEISYSFDQSMSQAKQDSRKSFHNREQVFSLDNISETIGTQAIANRNAMALNTVGSLDLIA